MSITSGIHAHDASSRLRETRVAFNEICQISNGEFCNSLLGKSIGNTVEDGAWQEYFLGLVTGKRDLHLSGKDYNWISSVDASLQKIAVQLQRTTKITRIQAEIVEGLEVNKFYVSRSGVVNVALTELGSEYSTFAESQELVSYVQNLLIHNEIGNLTDCSAESIENILMSLILMKDSLIEKIQTTYQSEEARYNAQRDDRDTTMPWNNAYDNDHWTRR